MPKLADQPLSGAYLKLKWAKEHINNLHFRVGQFCDIGVHRITVERDAKTGHETLKITPAKTVPPDFALMLGDALHNLSSALDHAWFELTAPDAPKKYNILFPIYPTEEHLAAFIAGRIKQASIVAVRRKLLDEIQPYDRGKGDILRAVHHLNIADKHRLLIPQVQIGRIEAIRCEDGDGVQFVIGPRHFSTQNSAVIDLGNHRDVKVIDDGQSTLAVVFGVCEPIKRIAGLPVIPELLKCWRKVRDTLAILER